LTAISFIRAHNTLFLFRKKKTCTKRKTLIPTFRRTAKIERQNTEESIGYDVTSHNIASLQCLFFTPMIYGHERFIKYLSVIGILSIASIFLFGFSLHIRFFRTFLNFQKIPISSPSEVLQPSNAVDTNASPSNTIFKLLSLFNPPDISPTSIQLFWTILKIIFVVFLLYYLYKLSRKGEVSSSAKWGILTFSLLIILVLVASNTTWLYYASFLVLPYILFLFVLKLDVVEKALLMVSLILFSIQEHVIFLSNLLGGKIASIVYIAGPTTYAYLLFLILILYSIRRFETQGK